MRKILLSLLLVGASLSLKGENFSDLIAASREAAAADDHSKAVDLASKAIELEPSNPQGWYYRGLWHDAGREFARAISDFNKVLALETRSAQVYQKRGLTHFKLGNIKQSIADFDQFIALVPSQSPYHWQRGISLYYDGKFPQGRAQFELHQTVNLDDVENAVWHYLCVAKANGLERAAELLINIQLDSRIPMMDIYALFAGKGSREDVLKAAAAGNPTPDQLKNQMFYAHFYLGLYEEAHGNEKASLEHIRKAVQNFPQDHYMGDVARVHLKLREKDKKQASSEEPALRN